MNPDGYVANLTLFGGYEDAIRGTVFIFEIRFGLYQKIVESLCPAQGNFFDLIVWLPSCASYQSAFLVRQISNLNLYSIISVPYIYSRKEKDHGFHSDIGDLLFDR